jgi:hypothetical protein
MIVTHTAREVIWGWDDPLLKVLSILGVPPRFPGIVENDTSLDISLAKHGPMRMYTGKYTTNLARNYLGT